MDIAEFEHISMIVGLTALVVYMMFIIYKLGKEARAGRYGYFILFGALGLGVFGFVAKSVIVRMLNL